MEGMWVVFGIWLLFGGVCVTSGTTVTIPNKSYKVARGDNVTIPCQLTPPPPPPPPNVAGSVISWAAHPDNKDNPMIGIATFFSPNSVTVTKNYRGRAKMIYDFSKGRFDLQLSSVTSKDTRVYECKAQIPDEDDVPSDTTSLTVLVAPSTPVCAVVGTAEYLQDITLTCRSEEGTPTPTYKWQSYDVNNVPRAFPPKATDQNGVLSLYNISKDASGYYICTSTNEIRSAQCNLTLAVLPPSMNMASMGGVIGVAVGVVVLLGIIILICCCCRRRKEKEENYSMGRPEEGEFTDQDPDEKEAHQSEYVNYEEERRVKSADRPQEDRSEKSYDRRSDYDDRRAQGDRRDRYDDRDRRDQGDRRDRYDDHDRRDQGDRRDRYDDRRDQGDRRDRYDDRRDDGDRRDRYDDRRDQGDRRDRYDRDGRYDDHRDHYDDSDRYSDRYDSRDRPPSVPPNKPKDLRN